MIAKKSPKANLENKRFAFLQIGLIIAGAIVLTAFNYANPYFKTNKKEVVSEIIPLYQPEIPTEVIFKTPQKKHHHVKTPIIDEVIEVKKIVEVTDPKLFNEKIKEIDIFDTDEDGPDIPTIDTTTHIIVEENPEFPGGYSAMNDFIAKNIEIPDYAMPLEGKVYIRFVVDRDGSITNVRVLKGIHQDYDKASVKVVSKMPKWKPGKQAGKAVKVQYEIPIHFKK